MKVKKFLVTTVFIIGITFALQGIAGNIKFTAIKPSSSVALSDEQQGILAVRTAKASVVNILGTPKQTTDDSSSLSAGSTSGPVSGPGFIIEADGLVVTNNHVVEDSSLNYFVIFSDGVQYPAQVLGQDRYDDVALLKIQATGLTQAHLGNSDALETGQTVFAIGNSLGKYQNTVTRGVVSGLGRGINENGDDSGTPTMHNWIQTDAAINLGNSGGPLVNMAGEVVGIDTLIDASGSSLGFAVPVNAVKDSVSQLKIFGKVSRPFLGVQFASIDPQIQAKKKLKVSSGALILAVADGTPASRAGIKVDDVITVVNGQLINSQNQLDALVQKYQAGNQVTFKILRDNQQFDLPVVLGQLP